MLQLGITKSNARLLQWQIHPFTKLEEGLQTPESFNARCDQRLLRIKMRSSTKSRKCKSAASAASSGIFQMFAASVFVSQHGPYGKL
jgi:hypothetical protein